MDSKARENGSRSSDDDDRRSRRRNSGRRDRSVDRSRGRRSRRRRRRRRSPSSSSSSESPQRKKKSKKEKSNSGRLGFSSAPPPPSSSTSPTAGTTTTAFLPNTAAALRPGGVQEQKTQLLKVLLVQQTEVTNRQVTRASRRLFIGNLPSALGLTEILIFNFFTDACNQAGIVADENPVLGVEIRPNNKFCFVEFRSYKLATEAMEKLQGLALAGIQLKIKRPNDFGLPPPHLKEFVCKGPKHLLHQKRPANPPPVPQSVVQKIAEAKRRAAAATAAVLAMKGAGAPEQKSTENAAAAKEASPILVLLNMINPHDLVEDDEYQEIRNEIGDECNKFGHLVDVVIPRAGGQDFDDDEDNSEDEDEGGVPGLGKVFLQYATKEDAARARATLHGRRFSENLVEARFFPEDRFLAKDYGFEA
mmetsp:Transcript_11677/g.18710  ORF Transcript_11677/g.18710 Transcript_11677/m.18710 type:complete len:419 (-) Transcript_11677:254-1510(-)